MMLQRRQHAIELMLKRIRSTAEEPDPGFPHYADVDTGGWTRSADGDWTGGFWVGELWLAAAATGDVNLRSHASSWSERLRVRASSDTIFRGFLFWYGAAIGSELLGDSSAAAVADHGAYGLIGLYNEHAGLLPLGAAAEEATSVGRSETNIDGVPGVVPLLVWAGARLGRPDFVEKARSQARRHVDLCVRDDGSVCQSASFDPATGVMQRHYTHKGVTDDSTWSRAQAWAMLGYAQSIHWLGSEFLDVAYRVADWWLEQLPADGVSLWDFDAPDTLRDTAATAIASAALLKLARVPGDRSERYRVGAERMVDALVSHYLTGIEAGDMRPPGILTDGCYNRRINLAISNELIWGDYMLFESLLHLEDRIDATRL
jgi:unsaturated chondroitin disaccharide hydrolase